MWLIFIHPIHMEKKITNSDNKIDTKKERKKSMKSWSLTPSSNREIFWASPWLYIKFIPWPMNSLGENENL